MNEIYIENQPSFINPIMKTITSMLFSYFIYMFKFNKEDNKIVKFVSPSVKINIDEKLIIFSENKINEHKLNKKENCKCRLCKLDLELKENKIKLKEKYL